MGQGNQTQRQLDLTQLADPKTIYGQRPYMGFNMHSGTRKPDPNQRPYLGKDHIWDSTRKPDPKTIGFNTVGTGKPDPKTIYGQRSYMGFNTVGQGNRTQTKDHIWAKTIFGQRPYMGFNTVGQGNRTQRQLDLTQLGQGNQTQRPYMGFNTVGQGNRTQRQLDLTQLGQGNQTQRPYMGKDHIWDSTQWDKETGPKPKTIFGQRPYMGFNTVGQGNRTQRP